MKYSIERACDAMRRASLPKRGAAIALVGLLSACAAAPGFRMQVTPGAGDGAQTGASHVDATATTPEIAITELDLGTVKRLVTERHTRQDEQTQQLFAAPQAYTVGPGDVLQIVVWDHPEFAEAVGSTQTQGPSKPGDPAAGFVVDQGGKVTFPYAGSLAVAGLRTEQIGERLTSALSRFFVKPQVTVRMASYRSRQVYVDGEVRSPGAFSVTDVPLSFYDAISRAGGFSDSADQSDVVLVRNGVSHRVDVAHMLAQGMNPSQLYLKAGDLLRVASREDNNVYVMGEVTKPGSAVPRRDGKLSLADALSQVGSVNASTADTAQMFVIRSRDNTPEVFHLDSRSPVAMLVAKEFELQPKDIVYVDGNGLVRFNRVLSLLMPLINTGLTAGVIAK
ncbi:polysaccharide biosynthesis/export family protein [Caballeronia concitans]|uniref:Polysaccharide export protein n=1 Tax=Caballeronia concitans TaxID=1777133 RepID=A0A658QQ32_9BURK|nr:polysaccharide export protein [Burkholderia sp. MR1]SAL09131.1 polysaccharide export protein [Caballeronia concitans]